MRKPDSTLVLQTLSQDPTMNFVGSSPYVGDVSATGIVLPPDPTTAQTSRYLCRTVGFSLPPRSIAVIRELRQLLTIGVEVEVEQGGTTYPFELLVQDPTWHFLDGNVSWHLRKVTVQKRGPAQAAPIDGITAPGYVFNRSGTDSAILSRRIPVTAGGGGYIPLNRGVPYGKDVAGLGTFRDIRFPWVHGHNNDNLQIEVSGPGDFVFYGSVYQTDPDERPDPPVIVEGAWTRPEDSFVITWPDARYWRIGAKMVVDIFHSEYRG